MPTHTAPGGPRSTAAPGATAAMPRLALLLLLAALPLLAVAQDPPKITKGKGGSMTALACADTMSFKLTCKSGTVLAISAATFSAGKRKGECAAEEEEERRRLRRRQDDDDEEEEEEKTCEVDDDAQEAVLGAVKALCDGKKSCKSDIGELAPMAEDCTGTGAYLEVKYKCEKPKPKKKAPKKTAPKKTSPKKTTKKHQKTGDDDDDDDAAAKAKADADAKAKEEQDKAEADAKAAEDARKAQEEADKKDAEEADRKAKENAERKAKEEAERLAQEAADKAKADADSKAKLEKDYETTVNSGPARQWENMLRQVLATNREIKVMEREKREALDKLRGFMAVFQKPAIEVKFGPLIMAAQMRLKQMDAALGVATGALQTYIGSLDKELQDRVREWMSRQQDRMKQEMAG